MLYEYTNTVLCTDGFLHTAATQCALIINGFPRSIYVRITRSLQQNCMYTFIMRILRLSWAVMSHVDVFWVVTSCGVVVGYQSFQRSTLPLASQVLLGCSVM